MIQLGNTWRQEVLKQRKLLEKITVISKNKLLVRFKDGTEIEQEISTER